MTTEGTVSLDDPTVVGMDKTVRRITMKQGEIIRIAFISDVVESRHRHYVKGVGYRRCLAYQGFCPACLSSGKGSKYPKEGLKAASEAFGANVFMYETEADGTLKSPLKGDAYLFIFGTDKFAALRAIKSMYKSLVGIDIQVTCTDEGFQKMNFTPYPREASASADPATLERIQKKVTDRGYPLDKFIAKEVSPDQMVKDYGLNPIIMQLPEAKLIIDKAAEIAQGQAANAAPAQTSAPAATVVTHQAPSFDAAEAPPTKVDDVKVVAVGNILDEL